MEVDMHSVSRVFALLAVPAMAIACAPQDPAPPAVVVVRVSSADSTRPAQFKAWANGGELEIRTANSHLRGDGGARSAVASSAPAGTASTPTGAPATGRRWPTSASGPRCAARTGPAVPSSVLRAARASPAAANGPGSARSARRSSRVAAGLASSPTGGPSTRT